MSRKQHWEKVYDEKCVDEVSWYQAYPQVSLELIRETGLGPEAAVIDVGGGASVLVDHLLDAGFQRPAVLDISGSALRAARERLGDRAGEVDWIEADVTGFRAVRPFDLWHDRAVFHFLTEAEDRRFYLDALMETVRPGGHVVIATFSPEGPTQCSGLDIVQYDEARMRETVGDRLRLVGSRDEYHQTPAGKEQAFRYFHLRPEA